MMMTIDFKKIRLRVLFAIVFAIAFWTAQDANASYQRLHQFRRVDDNGNKPEGSLINSGNTFYGMTSEGGTNEKGVIFKMDIDGNNYANIFNFNVTNGANPYGDLTLSGNTLYGMTLKGGTNNMGIIFKIETNGANYNVLHQFAGKQNDGAEPYGSLLISGTTLYGMTSQGGNNNPAYAYGVIFKIDTDGSNYTNIHLFNGFNGAEPRGSLTISGTNLYGMTLKRKRGTIFKIDTQNYNYTELYEFTGDNDTDGANPYGNLCFTNNLLFGMMSSGGISNKGVVFKIDSNGDNYTNLHQFTSGINDGGAPRSSLIIYSNSLAGMTYEGGINNDGVIFKIGLDGTDYINLHEFTGGADGNNPYHNSLLEINGYFYGMTPYGGGAGHGIIFEQSAVIPEPGIIMTLSLLVICASRVNWLRRH